ncbi:MAG: HAD-IA family hydrolase [Chloroflexi bacterium]|nr:HAD-IA family hydrolase [Chloroflexota bacterium]
MITAVFFDLYGTLAGFRPSRYEIQSEALADFGITVTPDGILRGYYLADAFMSQQNATKPVRSLSREENQVFFAEYERRVLRGAGVEVSQEQAWEIWRRIRRIDYALAPFDDTIPALEACRRMGLIVGLISNMNRNGDELADSLGLLPYLDFSITSHEVGAEKPDPLIFERALGRADARPESAVHVGDQLTSDVAGALNVGISAVLLDRDGNHRDYKAQPRITDLSELPELLETMSD